MAMRPGLIANGANASLLFWALANANDWCANSPNLSPKRHHASIKGAGLKSSVYWIASIGLPSFLRPSIKDSEFFLGPPPHAFAGKKIKTFCFYDYQWKKL